MCICTHLLSVCLSCLSQVFPNADLRLLKQCVSIRDELLQKKYDEHKVQFSASE